MKYPWRKVIDAVCIGWWERLGKTRLVYLDLECGHTVTRRVRQSVPAPKRVRCDGCDPVEVSR